MELYYTVIIFFRNPETRERPDFNDIMLVLLRTDKNILVIPEKDLATHPQAGVLGAPLEAGEGMYADLRNSYATIFL